VSAHILDIPSTSIIQIFFPSLFSDSISTAIKLNIITHSLFYTKLPTTVFSNIGVVIWSTTCSYHLYKLYFLTQYFQSNFSLNSCKLFPKCYINLIKINDNQHHFIN
jgi:hypothetical protein